MYVIIAQNVRQNAVNSKTNNKKPLRGLIHPEAAKEQILKQQNKLSLLLYYIFGESARERTENVEELKVPRMETIKTTAALFNLPVHFIRQKVTSGEIVAVRAGRRFLVNVDKLAEYLNSSKVKPETDETASSGRIKPIGR